MPYSDLRIIPSVTSISADNTAFTVTDATGTYPESPGGFAPVGYGTLTRPEESEVNIWFMYRFLPFSDISLIRVPPSQSTRTFANLSGGADRVIQLVELVVDNSLNWVELLDEGYDWDAFIDLAQSSGALGQLPVWMNVNESNCVYDALRRLNNKFPSNCSQEEWLEKNAMFIGTAATLSTLIPSLVPNVESTEDIYTEAQAQIDELVTLCSDLSCLCNC